jgi:hypothetical protein
MHSSPPTREAADKMCAHSRDSDGCGTTESSLAVPSYGNSGAAPMLPTQGRGHDGCSQTTSGTDMKRLLLASTLAALSTISPLAATTGHAQSVHQCATEAGTSFQSMPCPAGTDVTLPTSAAGDEDGADTATLPPVLSAPPASDSRRSALRIGASDMHVLNNRAWGKPQRITRNRVARAWHEHWSYAAGARDAARLHFINGRLASVDEVETQAPVVTAAPELLAEAEAP